jgi:hypothetical protein
MFDVVCRLVHKLTCITTLSECSRLPVGIEKFSFFNNSPQQPPRSSNGWVQASTVVRGSSRRPSTSAAELELADLAEQLTQVWWHHHEYWRCANGYPAQSK